jgi:hypothetical protein
MVISASANRADNFSRFTKGLLDRIPFLKPLKPNKTRGDRDSFISFDVAGKELSHTPSVRSLGINGQLTGSRADIIIADDIEIPGNSSTQDSREKLINSTHEFVNIIKPGGKIIYLGTPQTEESVYTTIKESGGYTTKIWPAVYPKDPIKYEGMLDEFIIEDLEEDPLLAGRPVDPLRFDEIELETRKAEIGSKDFALQYMLDTTLSDLDKYPLKLRDLIVTEVDKDKAPLELTWGYGEDRKYREIPRVGHRGDAFYRPSYVDKSWHKYDTKILAVDPSGRGADETAFCVMGKLGDKLYLLDFGGFTGGYENETLEKLGELAADYKVSKVIIESNFGDGMFTKLLTPVILKHHSCGIEEVSNRTQKEKRIIDTLEPLMNRHKLVVNLESLMHDIDSTYRRQEGSSFQYSMFYQMTRLTYDKGSLPHDDRVDSLAMAVAYFRDYMDIDGDKAKQKYQESLVEEMLNEFASNNTKSVFKSNPWEDSSDPVKKLSHEYTNSDYKY